MTPAPPPGAPSEDLAALLRRASDLFERLDADVAALRTEQDEQRISSERALAARHGAVTRAVERLGELERRAEQLAESKAKVAEFTAALEVEVPEPADAGTIDGLLDAIEEELRLARGITGTIRVPNIAHMIHAAADVLDRIGAEVDEQRRLIEEHVLGEVSLEGSDASLRFETGVAELRADLGRLDAALGPAAAPFDDARWESWRPPAVASTVVRIGSLADDRLAGMDIPALWDLRAGGLEVDAGGRFAEASAGVRSVVLRVLAALPPGGVQLCVIDPSGLGEAVAPFLGLGDHDERLLGGGVVVLAEDIEPRLTELTRHVEEVGQHVLGGRFTDLYEANEAAGETLEAARLVVVFDHPSGFGERASTLLRGITERGARAGVHTIVVRGRVAMGRPPPAAAGGVHVHLDADEFVLDTPDRARWTLAWDSLPDPDRVRQIVQDVGVAARRGRAAVLGTSRVRELLDEARARGRSDDLPVTTVPVSPTDRSTWWTGDATTGVGAAVGREAGRDVAVLWLGPESPGALVVGGAGGGLTTLLHDVVLDLARTYPPAELRVALVGLRGRRDIVPYGDYALPHALVVAADSEREMALSVLELLSHALDQRVALLRDAGDERLGYAGYRAVTGRALPRIVTVVDGVDQLLRPADAIAGRAVDLLGRLAEEGPAFGMHLLLAATASDDLAEVLQPLAGPPWVRWLVGTTVEDQAGWIGPPSSEVAALGAGKALVIDPARAESGERRVQVAWMAPHERAADLRDLHALAHERGLRDAPQVSDGAALASLESCDIRRLVGDPAHRAERRTPRLWLGLPAGMGAPVEVDLVRRPGENVLAIGADAAVGEGVLAAAVTSALLTQGSGVSVRAVDLGPMNAGFGEACAALGALGDVEVVHRRTMAPLVQRTDALVAQRQAAGDAGAPTVLFVVDALHNLRDPAVAAVITRIMQAGPAVGVHVIAWGDSAAGVAAQVPEAVDECSVRVVTAVDEDDSVLLTDSTDAAWLGDTHALLYDEDRNRLVRFRPFGLPAADWIATLPRMLDPARR